MRQFFHSDSSFSPIPQIAEPMQSTLEPLSQCVRLSFDTGNNEYAHGGPMFYLMRSFSSGTNIKVLIEEVFICVRQLGSHFGNDSSFKTQWYNLFFQLFYTPLYNVLHELEGDALAQDTSIPFNQVQAMNNHDTLTAAMESKRYNFILTIFAVQIPCDFLFRNMERALKYSDMYYDFFIVSQLSLCVHHMLSFRSQLSLI